MNWLVIGLVSILSAMLGAMGMGGGGVLVLYLTAFADTEQYAAQGVNLFFFVPVAFVALWIHRKNKLIDWSSAWPCVILGGFGVYFGVKLAMLIGQGALSKLFGGFLLLIGLRELFAKDKQKNRAGNP